MKVIGVDNKDRWYILLQMNYRRATILAKNIGNKRVVKCDIDHGTNWESQKGLAQHQEEQ
tara:strand:- start:243 stop:422 length:180 start_codon:yes stop_codon:yes gene_type:complete